VLTLLVARASSPQSTTSLASWFCIFWTRISGSWQEIGQSSRSLDRSTPRHAPGSTRIVRLSWGSRYGRPRAHLSRGTQGGIPVWHRRVVNRVTRIQFSEVAGVARDSIGPIGCLARSRRALARQSFVSRSLWSASDPLGSAAHQNHRLTHKVAIRGDVVNICRGERRSPRADDPTRPTDARTARATPVPQRGSPSRTTTPCDRRSWCG
jgi:hypothetical protein